MTLLFKSVFQHPENVVAELQHVLAPERVSAIDWSMLKLETGSFIDEKFANEHEVKIEFEGDELHSDLHRIRGAS